jgi:ABC-type branched-subunit amino acid transport system substrate-binding protein
MLRKLLLLTLTLCAALVFQQLDAQEDTACTPAAGDPIQIGAVFPIGDLFSIDAGEPLRGVLAMVSAVNACGGGRPIELTHIAADNRDEALNALASLDFPLIIGGGSEAVSEALTEASTSGDFVYWEVSESLDTSVSEWAFSPRPTRAQLGSAAVAFVTTQIPELIAGQPPRIAFIYEERAREIANGVLDAIQPQIVRSYSNIFQNPYRLAVQIREQKIDVVMIATFEGDANYFWRALREADANIAAWVQIGGQLEDTCDSYAAISVDATGEVARAYRQSIGDEVYQQYLASYQRLFNEMPGERADLAASGFYLIAQHILSSREATPESIRSAILTSDLPVFTGFVGEGLKLDAETRLNTAASTIIQQRQGEGFCTIAPDALATCANPLQSFPTWRERAVAESKGRCGVDQRDTAFYFEQEGL